MTTAFKHFQYWYTHSIFVFVFDCGGVYGLCAEARSIPNAESASSSAPCWNHSLQASPNCFPYIIATKFLLHGMRDMAVGIWFAYIGQVSLGYTTPGSRQASKALPYIDSKVMRPL